MLLPALSCASATSTASGYFLRWRAPPVRWCAGQQWRLRVALQPVHGRMNQGGFDSQRWAMANHQPLQGRVLRALMLALGFGTTQEISDGEWQLLSRTGIAHLMAISGLHIGLAALFCWVCAAGYVALSGANFPAQRGLLALTLWNNRSPAGRHAESMANFAVVRIANPHHRSAGGALQ